MSNSIGETEDIRQRLEKIEKAVNELHKLVKDLNDSVRGEPVKEISQQAKGEPLKEIAAHAQGEKVDDAERAMEIAHYYMKKDRTVALPMKAVRRDEVWLVDIDIGAVRLEIATVKVDAKTGKVLSYEITQKK